MDKEEMMNVEVSDLVAATYEMSEGLFGLKVPPRTPGIVVAVGQHDVQVQFECWGGTLTKPISCNPKFLERIC